MTKHLANSSLFPKTDTANQDFINWKLENSNIFETIELPTNILANRWIYLEDRRLGLMTDEKYKISNYGELIDADKEYIIKMVKIKNIKPLIKDIQSIIETIVQANLKLQDSHIEAKIRMQINNFSGLYYEIWKHLSGSGFEDDFYILIKNIVID